MEQGSSGPMSRRGLLTRGLALGALGAGVGAGATLGVGSASASIAPSQSPSELISSVMSVELMMVFAYGEILGSSKLGNAAPVVSQFLAHEQEHVTVIGGQLSRLGIAQPSGVSTVSGAEQVLSTHGSAATFSSLNTETDCVTLLQQVESVAEGAYYQALLKVGDARFITAALQIMAAEAQHWTVLTELKFPQKVDFAVPYAYVEGTYQ